MILCKLVESMWKELPDKKKKIKNRKNAVNSYQMYGVRTKLREDREGNRRQKAKQTKNKVFHNVVVFVTNRHSSSYI